MKSAFEVAEQRPALLGNPRTKEDVNILVPRNPRRKTQQETDKLADYLVHRFESPEHRPIFLKAAWRLDRGTIDRLVGAAFERGTNPRAYFIASVKRHEAYQ